jgi:hypothetical protein
MNELKALDRVVTELEIRTGSLRRVAEESGIPYDTVLRIKNRENDPTFSRVATLYGYLFGQKPEDVQQEA